MKKHSLTAAALMAAVLTVQPAFAADANKAQDERDRQAAQAPGSNGATNAPAQDTSAAQPAAARDAADRATGAAGAAADRAAGAAGAAADRATAGAPDKMKDQKFVQMAASGGMLEVQLAQLAQQRVQKDDVKQIAQHILQDHQQANQQLEQVAKSKGMEVPKQLNEVHQAMLSHMQKLQGQEFEKAYVYGQLGDHLKTILKYRDASQELQDSDLRQFAAQSLPKLQQHYQHLSQAANLTGAGVGEARPAGASERGSGAPGSGATGSGASGAGESGTSRDRTGTSGSGTSGSGTSGSGAGGSGTSGSGSSGSSGSGSSGSGSGGSGTGSTGGGSGAGGTSR